MKMVLLGTVLAACGGPPAASPPAPQRPPLPPPLPHESPWGVHVLALEREPDSTVWAGTYGRGIYRLDPGARRWAAITADDDLPGSISWDFVNAFAFTADGAVWYGTVGNGFGRSTDRGWSWRNWTFGDLGPEWQYVAPQGVRARGDTVYIATADGLRLSGDGGTSWRCVQSEGAPPGGAEGYDDACDERHLALPTEYLLALDVAPDGTIWVGHLFGASFSRDGGRTFRTLGEEDGVPPGRVRAVEVQGGTVWLATEERIFRASASELRFQPWPTGPGALGGSDAPAEGPRTLRFEPPLDAPVIATARGVYEPHLEGRELYLRHYVVPAPRARDVWALLPWPGPQPMIQGTAAGLTAALAGEPLLGPIARPPGAVGGGPEAEPLARTTLFPFARPVLGSEGNPHIDASYRYGSTMGGNFQQHQGVEFNNPAGTPVRAVGRGVVAFAGAAEAGARTVAIQHEQGLEDVVVYSVYFHNTELLVRTGERVGRGQVIARVGNTGRATNDHLHLEIHVAPEADVSTIVDPEVRFPPHTVNPQLWIEPLPGTGVVAGRVFDRAGLPVPGARIHGLVLPYPEETPFSFAETYRERAGPDPRFGEHFAVGDVPEGSYVVGVEVEGEILWRRARVESGRLTWVEFRPGE